MNEDRHGPDTLNPKGFTRRGFLFAGLGGVALAAAGLYLWPKIFRRKWREPAFIAKVPNYRADIAGAIVSGFKELGVSPEEIRGKRILLKPNLVETDPGAIHINTHPAVVYGAAQAFLRLGAGQVIVAEGPGHCRDTLLLLEESGLAEMLWHDRIPFVDLNYDQGYATENIGRYSSLANLTFPETLRQVDWVVSLAKLKTHHWAGITLSMKNLFGVMPGSYYGWPKNVLHYAGIDAAILDIVCRPAAAIRHCGRHCRHGRRRADHGNPEAGRRPGDGAQSARRGCHLRPHHGGRSPPGSLPGGSRPAPGAGPCRGDYSGRGTGRLGPDGFSTP